MTLAEAQTNLANAQAAYDAALQARAVGHGARTVSYQDIDKLANEMARWERAVTALSAQAQGISNPGIVTPKWT